MKKSTTVLLALAAVTTFASPAAVQAQVSNPLKFTVFGGAALPSGDASDALKTGYTVGGALDFRAPLMPVGLRAELLYSSLNAKDNGGAGSASMNDLGGNVNAVLALPSAGTPITLYLTGGPSLSRIEAKASDSGVTVSASENHFGFNIGGGIDFALGGLGTRFDVRYRQISMGDGDNFKTIPITFGITF
jgi:opacity protein-like surface antigen